MKKSSLILLGYGLGYITISFLTAFNCVSLTSKDLLPLSIASLMFALAEFCNSGGKLLILTIYQILFLAFAAISYRRFIRFKKYIDKKYCKKQNKFLFNIYLYYYGVAKFVANFFSLKIENRYKKLQSTCVLTQLLYILATSALVILLTVIPQDTIKTSDSFNNAIALLPLGLMFINVFFDSEFCNISTSFFQKLHAECERLKKANDECEEIFHKKILKY